VTVNGEPRFRLLPDSGGAGRRLGRHELHDPRSLDYDAIAVLPREQVDETWHAAVDHVSVHHASPVPPWDQGDIGACTAVAALGVLVSGSFYTAVPAAIPLGTDPAAPLARPVVDGHWEFTIRDALQLYREETRLDDRHIRGHWEPDDTGSTGLWSMKALQRRRMIIGYRHCFGLRATLAILAHWPVSIGVPWYESMSHPDRDARIHLDESSGLTGGHQVALVGIDADARLVRVRQSWGTGWGDGGFAWMSWNDLDALLHQGGDVIVPVI
jgi:hypothetical protein